MKNKISYLLLLVFFIADVFLCPDCAAQNVISPDNSQKVSLLLFVGTFTEGETNSKSEGIYLYEMSQNTGALNYITVVPSVNPAYLVVHPSKQWLYAVNELDSRNEKYIGAVSAFRIDLKNKQLLFINKVASCGNSPCYISIDKTGRYVMTANYGNGSVAILPVGKDGSLGEAVSVIQHQGSGPNSGRQSGSHAHMITEGQHKNIVYSADLGIDEISIYELDTIHGKLMPTDYNVKTKPGAGPRQLAFHPAQPWVYVVNELNGSIEAFNIDGATGALSRFQTISTLPVGETREPGSAAIHVTPNGKFLYATNRGEINNVAMFTINQKTGELTLTGHQSTLGKTPRDFVIDPTGTFVLVANQNTSEVVTFKIDPSSGKLIETGIVTKVPNPVCLKFLE
jgi:6-phosphogluconolactonase